MGQVQRTALRSKPNYEEDDSGHVIYSTASVVRSYSGSRRLLILRIYHCLGLKKTLQLDLHTQQSQQLRIEFAQQVFLASLYAASISGKSNLNDQTLLLT
jgi:hypothetical protein